MDKVFRLSVNTPLIWRGMEDTVFLMRPCRGLECGGKVLRVYLKINANPHKKYFVSEVYKMQRIYKLTKKIKDLGIF
jgi:hypothetical protein